MPVLLPTLSEDEISADITQQVEEIAEQLDERVSLSVADSRLRRRKAACEDALEVAAENPAAARRLTPVLLRVLEEECEREHADTVDELFRRLSTDAERAAAKTLAEVAEEALVESYEASTYEFEALLDNLVTSLDTARTTAAREAIVTVLATLSTGRPEQVATRCGDVIPTVIEILADSQDAETIRAGARLLSLVAVRNPDAVPVDHPGIQRAVNTIAQTDDGVRAYLWLLHDQTPLNVTPDGVTLDHNSFSDVLTGLIRISGKPQVSDIVSVASPALCTAAVHDLSSRIHNTDGLKRNQAARALGKVVAATEAGESEAVEALLTQVHTTDDDKRRLAAHALGEVVAATEGGESEAVEALLTRVHNTDGDERGRAAYALGEFVAATKAGESEAVEALATRIHNTDRDERAWAGLVLGEVVAATEAGESEAVEALASQVDNTDGLKRGGAAYALGEFVAATEAGESEAVEALVTRVHNTDGLKRWRATEALGEVVAATEAGESEAMEALLTRVHNTDRDERERAAYVLGEVVAATEAGESEVVEALVTQVHTTDGRERALVAQALGEVVAAAYPDEPDTVDLVSTLLRHDWLELFHQIELTVDISLRDFLTAASRVTDEIRHSAEALQVLLTDDYGRPRRVLDALATVCTHDDSLQPHPDLQASLQELITGSDLSAEARREALRVLKQLPTTATDVPHSTPE